MKKRHVVTLTEKKTRAGYVFTLPLILGFLFLFLVPIIYSLIYSFQELTPSQPPKFVGLDNFNKALFVDPDYIRQVFASIGNLIVTFPTIIIFSFLIAVLLNRKFAGRTFIRSVFFLPVVVTAGVVLMMQNDMLFSSTKTVLDTGSESLNSLKITDAIWKSLSSLKLDPRILGFVTAAVNKMYDITISSGVQILIFLAGLQTISPSLYEASSIEGATAWENLWKITVPIISPIILVNSVYTVIDAMGNLTNPIIRKLYEEAFVRGNYGFSSAMGWIYYVLIFICIGIVIGVISKMVYYENE